MPHLTPMIDPLTAIFPHPGLLSAQMDLAGVEAVERAEADLKAINSSVQIVRCTNCQVDLAQILHRQGYSRNAEVRRGDEGPCLYRRLGRGSYRCSGHKPSTLHPFHVPSDCARADHRGAGGEQRRGDRCGADTRGEGGQPWPQPQPLCQQA